MKISGLYIYPVKSLGGIAKDCVDVTAFGPHMDRRFMLVDGEGRFISQRKYPQLALIKTRLDTHLHIAFPKQKPIPISLAPVGNKVSVQVWSDTCSAVDLGDEIAAEFSRYLEMPVRLVFMPEETVRSVKADYAVASATNKVGFADSSPFLIITEASLEDLNQRLGMNLLMNRFRPNIVISGATPYAEDTWRKIRVGGIELHLVKPCGRCVVTCTDQATGERGVEPLQTLATYRKQDKNIMFGQNSIHVGTGTLSVGDRVEILA